MDNEKATFGSSNDLEIFHNGSNSYIDDTGTGDLFIRGSNDLYITNPGGTETKARFATDGAVYLYYNNSIKLATNDDGVDFGDNVKLRIGDAPDYKIYHNGNNTYHENYTGDLFIKSDQMYLASWTSGENYLHAVKDGAVSLYYDNFKSCSTNTSGIDLYGPEAGDCTLNMNADEGDDNGDKWRLNAGQGGSWALKNWAPGSWDNFIVATVNGGVELYYDNSQKFFTKSSGVELTGSTHTILGDLHFNNNTNGGKDLLWDESADSLIFYDSVKASFGTDSDLQIYHDGSGGIIKNTTGSLYLNATNSDTGIKIIPDSAVELYCNNVKKIQTQDAGVTVYGTIHIGDGASGTAAGLGIGDGDDLQLYHNGTNSYIDDTGTGALIYKSGTHSFRNAADSEQLAQFNEDSSVQLYYDNVLQMRTHANGIFTRGIYPITDDTFDIGSGSERFDDIYATNGTINTSDRNEKNTIVESDLGLDFVNKLKPVSYKWNKNDGKTHYGLIAQDVEEVLSTEGKTDKDFAALNIPTEGPMGLNYSELISPLIKAVQELTTEVNTLKAKVAALEAG